MRQLLPGFVGFKGSTTHVLNSDKYIKEAAKVTNGICKALGRMFAQESAMHIATCSSVRGGT